MLQYKKRIMKIAVLSLALTMLTSSMMAFAQTYKNKYVYGSAYTVVADGTNDDCSTSYVTVKIDKIYKSTGEDSNYTKVKADIIGTKGSQISTESGVVLRLGETTNIKLNMMYGAGSKMKLRMKGNNSSLDCIVDFTAAISS